MANMPSYITTCWEHSADMAIRLYTALEQNVWLGDGVECMAVTTTREAAVLKKKDHAWSLHKIFHFTEYFQNTNFQNRDDRGFSEKALFLAYEDEEPTFRGQNLFLMPLSPLLVGGIFSTTWGYMRSKRSLRLLVSLFGARTRTLSLSTTATAFSIISRLRIKPTIFYSW